MPEPVDHTPSEPLPGSERPPAAAATSQGPLPPDEELSVSFVIRPRPDGPPLPGFADYQRPGRPTYLSAEEFTERHGAAADDLQAVADYVSAHGMTIVERSAGRRSVIARGTAAQVNAALAVQLTRYEAPLPPRHRRKTERAAGDPQSTPARQLHRGFDGPVHLPSGLIGVVTAVVGLDNRRRGGVNDGDPPNTNLTTVPQVAQLYNYPEVGAAGQTIGIFCGGTNYDPADITQYFASLPAGWQTAPGIVEVSLTVDGTSYQNHPHGSLDPEIAQDIQIAATVAQGVTIAVYTTTDSEAGWLAYLNRVLIPDPGDPQPSVLTSSWYLGHDDSDSSSELDTLSQKFQELASRGVTVFNAQGDNGSDDGLGDGKCHVQYPASDPWVTSCGGTTIGNIAGSTFEEVVWNDDTGSTGGGVSDHFALPVYQSDAGLSPASKNDGKVRRGVPDVAVNASANSGYGNMIMGGTTFTGGGTSASAPLLAGLTAVLNAALGHPVGFLNTRLYQFGESVCRDITSGDNNSGSGAPYYTAGSGWDACTGWGSFEGTKLLSALIDASLSQRLEFWVSKSTFGVDEVTDTKVWPNAFKLILDGFAPFQLSGAPLPTPTFSGPFDALPGISITANSAGPRWQSPAQTYSPQRLEIPYDISFADASLAVFPATGSGPIEELLEAVVMVAGRTLPAAAEFELVAGEDPHFTNIGPGADNPPWMSQDLRVFTVTPGVDAAPVAGVQALAPATGPSTLDPAAGYAYAQELIASLNANYSDPAGLDPFTNVLPVGTVSADSSVMPTTPNPNGSPFDNYSFAVARVRLHGGEGGMAEDVKVFFRLFITQSNDTDYQPATTYLSTLDASSLPATPEVGAGNATIPCFATANRTSETDYEPNGPNNQTLVIPAGSDSLWAYFGCFLNVYDPHNTVEIIGFPLAVNAVLVGTHHCLVAQIAYDGAPIEDGSVTPSPENSDKLAQRNLQVTASDNPGSALAHRVPQTFDLRPSRIATIEPGHPESGPDELLIDWGNTPTDSVASIYWPQLPAATVIALADKLYATHELSASDAHTLQMPVTAGISYVPIPAGIPQNIAGLFTIDLPTTVSDGQEFTIVVQRVANRSSKARPGELGGKTGPGVTGGEMSAEDVAADTQSTAAEQQRLTPNWRYVVGSFQITIPVATRRTLLAPEQSTLAILKWRLSQIPVADRWHPVLTRYIAYVSGRVTGLGGNAGAVKPSPLGYRPSVGDHGHKPGQRPGHGVERCSRGKITALEYDRFGDFRGFALLTEDGHRLTYRSTEHELESLVRFAWLERVVVEVVSDTHDEDVPKRIVLLRAPHHD